MKWVLFALVLPVFAQDAFLAAWGEARAKQPADIEFTISFPKTTYIMGEAMPLTAVLTGSGERRILGMAFTHPGRGINTLEFTLDRQVDDPLANPGENPVQGGSFSQPSLPFREQVTLNEWVRWRESGTYRLYAHTAAVAKTKVYSNVLTIEVQAAPPGWALQQLALARAELARIPANPNPEAYRDALPPAFIALAFLELPEAGEELLRQFPKFGRLPNRRAVDLVLAHPDHAGMLKLMRERLVAPDQPVNILYVATLCTLSVMVEGLEKGSQSRYTAEHPWRRAEGVYRQEYLQQLQQFAPQKVAQAEAP